jgi:bifunctional non-homologous end joining protein LigD
MKSESRLQLISRNEKDLGGRYPQIVEALRELPVKEAMLDGEVVALDEHGRSSFQLLQSANMGAKRPPLFYYAFDVIQLDGKDLTGLPLMKRKAMAEALVRQLPDTVRFSASIAADTDRVFKEIQARGLEGLIAKRRDSKYEIGRRSGAWVKFKWTNEQEFVIGGFSAPKGARKHFGAILVGYYGSRRGDEADSVEGRRPPSHVGGYKDRELVFASKVGTGFDQKTLDALYAKFKKLIRSDPPFVNVPTARRVHGSQSLSLAEMRRCTWLDPKLVCQIRFSEWTRDGGLRQPVFLGLREDRNPLEVVREKAKD